MHPKLSAHKFLLLLLVGLLVGSFLENSLHTAQLVALFSKPPILESSPTTPNLTDLNPSGQSLQRPIENLSWGQSLHNENEIVPSLTGKDLLSGHNHTSTMDDPLLNSSILVSSVSKPRIVIIGPVKDAVRDLKNLRRMFIRLMEPFDIVQLIFFENDSADSTVNALRQWDQDPNFPPTRVHSEQNVSFEGKTRTVILSYARNRLWQLVQEVREPFEYVLSVDMDGVNAHLDHVSECLNLPPDWTVCCANTYAIYYDLWALRTYDSWVEGDVLKISLKIRQRLFRHIPAFDPPILVKSCFGGAALYKYSRIRHLNLSTYAGLDDEGNKICEHVVFHESLRRQFPDLRMYIQPKMMNDGKPRGRKVNDRLAEEINTSFNNPNMSHYYRYAPRRVVNPANS